MGICAGPEVKPQPPKQNKCNQYYDKNIKLKVAAKKEEERTSLSVHHEPQLQIKSENSKTSKNLFKMFSDWGDSPPKQLEVIETKATKVRKVSFQITEEPNILGQEKKSEGSNTLSPNLNTGKANILKSKVQAL